MMHSCIECNVYRDHILMYEWENSLICWQCVLTHNGPGRFEKYSRMEDYDREDLEPLAQCLILHSWSMLSGEDEWMSNEGWGYLGRFGRYHLCMDPQGFVSFDEYPTEERSIKEFQELYEQGWGADENDAYIEGNNVSFDGKALDVWGRGRWGHPIVIGQGIDQRRLIARVRLEAMKTGYHPNLWLVSDHGNLQLTSY